MSKIGILGGTFNPIHKAHIELATLAKEETDIDYIILMPSYITNLKDNSNLASAIDRVYMCKLATQKIDYITVSRDEVRRKEVSYTCDTLKELKNGEDEFSLILGADQFMMIDQWKNYKYVLDNASIIVCPRNDIGEKELKNKANELSFTKLTILSRAIDDISSSMIRQKVYKDEDVSEYIDEKVLRYIKINNLYKGIEFG